MIVFQGVKKKQFTVLETTHFVRARGDENWHWPVVKNVMVQIESFFFLEFL